MYPAVELRLPTWISNLVERRGATFPTLASRMAFVIELARQNIDHGGGPFGAAVFESESGKLVAPGVNLVLPLQSSLAHAEAVAIALAQRVCETYDLSSPGLRPMELVTSAQPCIQCYGILWWSGLQRLVIGARKEDVEQITGFMEGPLPPDWIQQLAVRPPLPPVTVVRDVLREEARAVLQRYRQMDRPIYHPGSP